MAIKFVDRKSELKKLEEYFKSDNIALIYGRRRIGKTRLAMEFLKNKKGLYLSAIDRGVGYNLAKFSKELSEKFSTPGLRFESFIEMFKFLNHQDIDFIALDEFGYLISALPEFQEIADFHLKKKLILTGSTVSLIESRLMNYKNPLYGRINLYMKVGQLSFESLKEWFSKADTESLIKIYSLAGGIPKYLEFFHGDAIENEAKKTIFEGTHFLFRDAKFLLEEELRDPSRYYLILEALAKGKDTINEISGYTKIEAKDIPFYLKTLENLHLIKSESPLLFKKGKKYLLGDNYFRFWFTFISPYEDELERDFKENALSEFKANFNTYLERIFEDICREYVLKNQKITPFTRTKTGRWWHKDREIDIVALNDDQKKIAFFECKWKDLTEKQARCLLKALEEKSKFFDWNTGGRTEYFGIFAKKIENKAALNKEGFLVFDLRDF
jgi:hypothetical protein